MFGISTFTYVMLHLKLFPHIDTSDFFEKITKNSQEVGKMFIFSFSKLFVSEKNALKEFLPNITKKNLNLHIITYITKETFQYNPT